MSQKKNKHEKDTIDGANFWDQTTLDTVFPRKMTASVICWNV